MTICSDFYFMRDPCVRGALVVATETDFDEVAVLRAECLPNTPVIWRHRLGGKPRDMIGTTYGIYLFYNRVIDLLCANHLSGWTNYPVRVYGKNKKEIKGYCGFAVTGRSGPIDWSNGREEKRPPYEKGLPERTVWVGAEIDLRTWDGSDFFVPDASAAIIVTERVKHAFEVAKITNLEFTRMTESERSWPLK